MALITLTVRPADEVPTWDFATQDGRRLAGLTIDGASVHLGHHDLEEQDAAIVASANLLIGVLVGLRDAAMQRIREEKAAHDAAWAAEMDGTDAPLADAGDIYAGIGIAS